MVSWFRRKTRARVTDGPRLMLIDDHLQRRYSTAQMLRSEGYEVESAAGHESWLALFKSCLSEPAMWVSFIAALEPDLILIDLDLQSGSALHTVGALRRHPLTEHIPIMVLGNSRLKKELGAAISLGAIATLSRPLWLAGFGPAVDGALADAAPRRPLCGDELPEIWLS